MGVSSWDLVESATHNQTLIAILFSITLSSFLVRFWFSSHRNELTRVGYPWWLSLLPSKPVHDLFEEGYKKVRIGELSQMTPMHSLTPDH
jgi:hypothetical protein